MATVKKEARESQIGLITEQRSSQTNHELCLFGRPRTLNSVASPYSSTDAIIMVQDNDLKPKNTRLGSWWDNTEEYNELSSVFVGMPKPKHEGGFDSWISSAKRPLGSLFSTKEIINIEDDDKEETLESERKKPRLGIGSFFDDSTMVKAKDNDAASSTDPHEKKTQNDERLVSSHHDLVDLCEDESVGESTTRNNNKGSKYVTLEDLGVSVEDLKSIPWEAFDPTWEIRSKTMDPWLGGYVQDIFSSF